MLAVTEIRRLGLYGLTDSEITRYKQAVMAEIAQSSAQSEQRSNEEVLNEVIQSAMQVCSNYVVYCWCILSKNLNFAP
jgi:hypothetical protein